jgi:hypothetical protein
MPPALTVTGPDGAAAAQVALAPNRHRAARRERTEAILGACLRLPWWQCKRWASQHPFAHPPARARFAAVDAICNLAAGVFAGVRAFERQYLDLGRGFVAGSDNNSQTAVRCGISVVPPPTVSPQVNRAAGL